MLIPKVIHYCWFGDKQLPQTALKYIESWKKYCPNYEIKEWNESNYDLNSCAYVQEAVREKKWAFVSDYARFDILYKYGGIYFDTDVELINSIEDILKAGPFMGCEQTYKGSASVATGLGLAATPQNPIFKEIIDNYKKSHFSIDNTVTVVARVTGILEKHGYKEGSDIQNVDGINIYPWDYFCPLNYYTGELTITKNTKSIHHYCMSWQSPYRVALKRCQKECKQIFGNKIGELIYKVFTFPFRSIHKTYEIMRKIHEKS